MNKFSRLFLAGSLATALFLGYGLVKAQDAPAMDDQGGDHPMMHDGPDGHGDWGEKRMDRLKEKLGLTDDQAAQLKVAFKKQMEANKPLHDQEKIDIDTLQQKVDLKASDSDIKGLLDKLKEDRKALQDAQERSMEKIRTILNPTQQAKWVLSMRGQMRKGWGRKMDGAKKTGMKKRQKTSAAADAQPTPDAAGN